MLKWYIKSKVSKRGAHLNTIHGSTYIFFSELKHGIHEVESGLQF